MSIDNSNTAICHVVHTLNLGGAEILACQIADYFSQYGRVVFACLDEAGSMAEERRVAGNSLTVVHRNPGYDLHSAHRLAKFFKRENVSLIHAHQYTPFFYAALSRFFGKHIPILFTEHGRDYPDRKRLKRILANRLLLRSEDRIIAVAESVRQSLSINEGISRARIGVIRNGVAPPSIDFPETLRSHIREQLGIRAEELAIAHVARLDRLKDHITALRAIALSCTTHPEIKYFCIGGGNERASLEQLTRELGITRNVTFLGERNNIPSILQGMDLFVLSSISEGMPLTLLEAMLTRLPCIATCVGGIPEVIVDGLTGILVNPRCPHELSNAIINLTQSPLRRLEMGNAGRIRAITFFNLSNMMRAYMRQYQMMGLNWETN